MAEYGFDLTDFGSVDKFKKVLKNNKLPMSAKKKCEKSSYGELCSFEFANKDVKLITANNPLTGEHANYPSRPKEKGYASYIGLTGKKESVSKLKTSIVANAEMIKGKSSRRAFI